ncbi:hypothetical protein KI387_030622, partial [Taxus chinensis]
MEMDEKSCKVVINIMSKDSTDMEDYNADQIGFSTHEVPKTVEQPQNNNLETEMQKLSSEVDIQDFLDPIEEDMSDKKENKDIDNCIEGNNIPS